MGPFAATLNEAVTPRAERVLLVLERDGLTRYRLPETKSLRIGRNESCEVLLKDPLASRHHATLHVGERLELVDAGSQNGTLVKNDRVRSGERVSLEPGDAVQIGSTVILVQWSAPVSAGAVGPDLQLAASVPRVVVRDQAMQDVYRLASRVAGSNINVLIFGETGVGKELIAETVHRSSGPRSSGPFVRINCAALGEQLFESEMFGHERGSFTGAVKSKPGLLETAHTGTAFLDEVGELSLVVQAKLLRVLESRQVTRVGGLSPRAIDVRFVAATNRDLKAEVAHGRFREDLYYRLAGATLSIPPLRARPSEIMPLVEEVSRSIAATLKRSPARFSNEAERYLLNYRWPGNVRELRNVIECAILRSEGALVEARDLPDEVTHAPSSPPSRVDSVAEFGGAPTLPPKAPSQVDEVDFRGLAAHERSLSRAQLQEKERILEGLAACNGNQTRAAEYLGIPRRTLVAKLAAYAIPRPRKVVNAFALRSVDQEPEAHTDG